MARVSNTVVATLNFVFLLLGLALIGGGIYFHVHAFTACQKSLQNPLLILGAFVFTVSLLGFAGSCCKNNFFLKLYLFFMLLLIIGLIVFTIFLFVITNESAGKAVSGKGFKEYRLGDYSNWLRNHFVKGKNWAVIRSCLVDANVCKVLTNAHDQKAADFFNKNVSPIKSGCCRPPTECGFEYQNATLWTMPMPESASNVTNSDCTTWGNNPSTLCYNCNSCKAGFLANIRKQWRNLAIFLICVILFIMVAFSIAICAKRNNQFYYRFSV